MHIEQYRARSRTQRSRRVYTKGVLVAPTVFGNVIVGPTATDVERKDDTSSKLRLEADAAGVTVQRGAVDATAAGAAALAAVGAGLWDSTLEIGERIPTGDRVEPRRDARWRQREHAAWRAFVERAAEL
jgi:hypothetical protein